MGVVFLGRQPIFDRRRQVFGYELLHRAGEQNAYTHTDGSRATKEVINTGFNVLSMSDVVGSRRAFVNITRKLLVDQTYTVLPSERVVVELLESVPVDDEVITACRGLKEAGYVLALDDFADGEEFAPLLEFADILKVDFRATGAEGRRRMAEKYRGGRVALLAEKVETHEEFQEALGLGYAYFQGYFFCRPEVLSGHDIPAGKQNYLMFLQEVNRRPMDCDRIEMIVKSDVSLAMKLLRYLNSAAMGFQFRVTSIRRALALLGEGPLRKWASLVTLCGLTQDKPPELLVTSLVRARCCEELAGAAKLEDRGLDAFLMGLFSAMDAFMDRPLEEVLATMPVPADVSAALLGADTALGGIYQLVRAIERSDAAAVERGAGKLGLPLETVTRIYGDAVRFADEGVAQMLAA